MGALEEFNKQTTTLSYGGFHDLHEAGVRTPKGFVLTKLTRSKDYYHWVAEYTKIEEWKKTGGVHPFVDEEIK